MIHHVFATKLNIGDWLSARGIQGMLSPLPVVEHLCDDPFVPGTLKSLSALGARDLVVIGGGGLFMDYFAPFWEGFRSIADRVAFGIWGVGYCDTKGAPSRTPENLLCEIISRSRFCSVRDSLTRAYLAEAAIPPPIPCPAVSAVETDEQGAHGLLYADHYNMVGPEGYASITATARSFAASTGRPYMETDNQISRPDERELEATLAVYRRSDLIVSSRLHGCIIGLALGRKVLAVSGDRKVESFMDAAGLSDWVCEVRDEQGLKERMAALPTQRTPAEFVAWARSENRRLAAHVRRIATELENS
jgi:polysaccharide pyruvyl transferase WcaK-like protein